LRAPYYARVRIGGGFEDAVRLQRDHLESADFERHPGVEQANPPAGAGAQPFIRHLDDD